MGETLASYCTTTGIVLGRGRIEQNNVVFKGKLENQKEVAIKKILKENRGSDREVELQLKLDHHNVVKILKVENNHDFRYSP